MAAGDDGAHTAESANEDTILPPLPEMEKGPAFPWLFIFLFAVIVVIAWVAYTRWAKSQQDELYEQIGGASYAGYQVSNASEEYYNFKSTFSGEDLSPLKNALFRRALSNIELILRMQEESQAANMLYKRSMIGESAWKNFKRTEELVKGEVDEVREEADDVHPGWGASIWQQALQLHKQTLERKASMEKREEQEKEAVEKAKRDKIKAKKDKLKEKKRQEDAEKAAKAKEELAVRAAAELLAMAEQEEKLGGGKAGGKASKAGSRRGSQLETGSRRGSQSEVKKAK